MADSTEPFAHLRIDLDEIARRLKVQSVLVMRSTPTHMQVEATAGDAESIYTVGAEGRKGAAFADAQELYCERVVDTGAPLFVRDSTENSDFAGNEDEVEYGLSNYLGYPIANADGTVFGTVCVLDNQARDYSAEDIAEVERLRDAAEKALRAQQ